MDGAGQRLLLLLPFVPRHDAAHGGGRALAALIEHLAERHQVALLCLRAPDEPPVDDRLRERCERVEEVRRPLTTGTGWRARSRDARRWSNLARGRPFWVTDWSTPGYAARVRALARDWRPDIVQAEFHIMAQYLPALGECPAPRLLTQHDPGARAARDLWAAGQAPGRLLPRLSVWAWRRYERAVARWVDAIVVFTERDRRAVAELAPRARIVTIPLGVTLPPVPLDPIGSSSLLFIGNFDHTPNVDAAIWLAREIYPGARARCPDATLAIVGKAPPEALQRLATDGVVVTGFVPDVVPYLERAAVVVAPLRLGGGMRVKALEAIAAGKAVVASRLALEGVALVPGVHAEVADTAVEFQEAIARLLADPARRRALGAQARAWAETNLGWPASVAAYERLYQELREARWPA